MKTTLYPSAHARGETENMQKPAISEAHSAHAQGETKMNSAEAREAARLLALAVEGALMQRLAQDGTTDVSALRTALLTVAAGIAKPRRRFANCGMGEAFWQDVRKRWELDPRDGYAWLSKELGGAVSGAAIRKRVLKEEWSKSPI